MQRSRSSLVSSFGFAALAAAVLAVAATSLHAQQASSARRPCVSDWSCGSTRPPLGFYVDSIIDDGRYIQLEDGTLWEVQLDYRAAVAAWQRGLFLEVRRILAPTGDYEWQFIKSEDPEWHVAARFAGRVR